MRKYSIYVDGSSNVHSSKRSGGYGMLVIGETVTPPIIIYSESNSKIDTTNNEQELTAMLQAFKYIINMMSLYFHKIDDYEIFCDSSYAVKSITEWAQKWEKNGWINTKKQEIANIELMKELYSLYKQYQFKITWIRGHSGNVGNELADALATNNRIKFKKVVDKNGIRYLVGDFNLLASIPPLWAIEEKPWIK